MAVAFELGIVMTRIYISPLAVTESLRNGPNGDAETSFPYVV